MFHVDPDAWANVIPVIVIIVSIVASITRKLSKRRSKANTLWYTTEISTSFLIALIAWEMHPFLTILPEWATRGVFTALAVHAGVRFIQKLQDSMAPT